MSLPRVAPAAPTLPAKPLAAGPAARAAQGPTALAPAAAGDRLQATGAQEAAALAAMKAWVAQDGAEHRLQKGAEAYVLESQVRPAKGVAVLLHGYSACPWQMEGLAKQLAEQGMHVLVPRLPGHGLAGPDGKPDNGGLPGPHEAQRYQDLADEAFALAAATGLPVTAAGLSVGGATALSMAERHPVARVVAIAPYLRPGSTAWAFDAVFFLDKLTFGLTSRLVGLIPWAWPKEISALTEAGKRPGHHAFRLGNLLGATRLGTEVIAKAGGIQGQVQILSTATDTAADLSAMRRLAAALPGGAPAGWQHYPVEDKIPHPMNDPLESPQRAGEVESLAARFLVSGQPARRLPPDEG